MPWYGIVHGYSIAAWVFFGLFLAFTGVAITGGYHRMWAHRAYSAHWTVRLFYMLFGAMALQQSILIWASQHRVHHQSVDDVDIDQWAAVIREADATDDANEGLNAGTDSADLAEDDLAYALDSNREEGDVDWVVGEEVVIDPFAWANGCDGGKVWSPEDRNKVTSLTTRQTAVIGLGSDNPNRIFCTGVMIDDTHFLTAAHCVVDCDNNGPDETISLVDTYVCSWGNAYSGADCDIVLDIEMASGFDLEGSNCSSTPSSNVLTGNVDDDWALLTLPAPLGSTMQDFDMSTLSSVAGKELKSFGFPPNDVTAGGCPTNTATPIDSDDVSAAAFLFHQEGVDMTDFLGPIAHAKLDAGPRQSGSPIFYCSGSDTDCDPGEKGVVAMVLTGWSGSTLTNMIGPRVPAFRDDLMAILN